MNTLTVDLGERSYPIFIGQNLLTQADLIKPFVKGQQVLMVSNTTIAPLYMAQARQAFAGCDIQEVILPDGEEYKNLEVLNQIFDVAIAHHFDRSCTFVALGGGVIGDMTGFAAASYQRGVNFIQMPTTLLSQVDSSVGGKTGVDVETLKTLDERQLASGIAEVIKYGLIEDLAFFEWLEQNIPGLVKKEAQILIEAIKRSCQCKADVVAQDEKEQGKRALLNLGHTFGHAIEAGMGYGNWLHGEGVSAGTLQAVYLSKLLGQAIFEQAQLPVYPPSLEEMPNQKFVLLKAIGQAYVTGDYPSELLVQTLTDWRA